MIRQALLYYCLVNVVDSKPNIMVCCCKLLNNCTRIVSVILLFSITSSFGQYCGFRDVEPQVKMTHGEIWPKPLAQKNTGEYLKFEPGNFFWNVRSKYFLNDSKFKIYYKAFEFKILSRLKIKMSYIIMCIRLLSYQTKIRTSSGAVFRKRVRPAFWGGRTEKIFKLNKIIYFFWTRINRFLENASYRIFYIIYLYFPILNVQLNDKRNTSDSIISCNSVMVNYIWKWKHLS